MRSSTKSNFRFNWKLNSINLANRTADVGNKSVPESQIMNFTGFQLVKRGTERKFGSLISEFTYIVL